MVLTKLSVRLRIAIVQLNPQIGRIDETTFRAKQLISRIEPYKPDIVVFPEFALSGYNFHSRAAINPYLSLPTEGPAWNLSRDVSKRLGCITVMGYPEGRPFKTDENDKGKVYNAAIVVDGNGNLIFNYRKSFMYYTEEEWGCSENPAGFQTFDLPIHGKARDPETGHIHDIALKTALGICMDLSPYKFEAPFYDCEFATFNIDNGTELMLCPMAWLHGSSVTRDTPDPDQQKEQLAEALKKQNLPQTGSQGDYQVDIQTFDDGNSEINKCEENDDETLDVRTSYIDLKKPDMSNVNYWMMRFMPFLALRTRESWFAQRLLFPLIAKFRGIRSSYVGSSMHKSWVFSGKNAILVMANRCGVEDGTTVYAGSSGIYKFNGKFENEEESIGASNRSVDLLGNLGKGHEGVLLRDVNFEIERDL